MFVFTTRAALVTERCYCFGLLGMRLGKYFSALKKSSEERTRLILNVNPCHEYLLKPSKDQSARILFDFGFINLK